MVNDCENSDLERWLRQRNMTTKHFVELVGCSRPVIWRVKKGIAICPMYAKRIYEITEGQVKPIVENVGRPW